MKTKHTLLAVALAAASLSAQADLARLGPVNLPSPPGHGFPLWYQDLNGTVLDICLPDASDPGGLQATACLLGAGNGVSPFDFPTNFPGEAFYFRAVSTPLDMGGGKRAIVTLALEGAFSAAAVNPGDQITFTRIRVTAGVPVAGDYTVYHPYGVETFQNVGSGVGNRDITFSEDVGVARGIFTGALTSRVGPFLQRADSTGVPLGPVTVNGAQFLSDGALPEFVTGSPFGTNYVMICGKDTAGQPIILGDGIEPGTVAPGTCAHTNQFALTGRLHNLAASPIGSPLDPYNVFYKRDASGTQINVYARSINPLPGQPAPKLSAATQLLNPVLMSPVGAGSLGDFYGQLTDPLGEIPGPVMIVNSTDNPPILAVKQPADVVTVASANYDGTSANVTVLATTSDKGKGSTSPPPTLRLQGFPGATLVSTLNANDPAEVTLTTAISGGIVPDTVTVVSDAGGSRTATLTRSNKAFPAGAPIAIEDSALAVAGGPSITIPVTGNDIGTITVPSLTLFGTQPSSGSVVVNPANNNTFIYTPGATTGPTSFRYQVSNTVGSSNVATVTVTVDPPAGGPVPIASPDTATVSVSQPVTITVLANDSGNGGTLNPASVVISNATGGTASVNASGVVTYTAGAVAGVFGFDYTVTNTNGQVSPPAHVTVTVVNPEQITFAAGAVTCRAGTKEWIINGTSTVTTSNTIFAYTTATVPASPTAAQTIGSGLVGATGAFQIRVKPGPTCISPISFKSSLNTQRNNVAVTIRP